MYIITNFIAIGICFLYFLRTSFGVATIVLFACTRYGKFVRLERNILPEQMFIEESFCAAVHMFDFSIIS